MINLFFNIDKMQHTNRLINSSSPYLLQHAHNPVDWFSWGNEALQKSIIEQKPILVSIGYSSCHWCHVMERESFEDETTAALMNQHFVCIKIDREERPDLDHIYMDAVQAMTGAGGWPLNVFLTPDLKPFFGGTYFPPINAHGRMSWKNTLTAVSKAFSERKDEIELQAATLTKHIADSNAFGKIKIEAELDTSNEILEKIADNILENADTVWGGFGNAPKFPQTFSIQYLLRQYHYTKQEKYLNQATLSLDKMILGGIYDQVGGGFARYSTDEKWFAPHFEKMLYDNALLVAVLCEAYQITKKNLYAETIHQTLNFIEREMMSNEFAFYSALDADTEGVEGKFYTWTKDEIESILNPEDAALFCEVYDITELGNWEHTNILYLKKSVEKLAIQNNIDVDILKTTIEKCKKILLKNRNERTRPLLDDKTLCSWNALMNIAYCKAYAATANEHYKEIAIKNADFILNKLCIDNEIMHCYKQNKSYINGFIDDYAYTIWCLIHLQEITGNQEYLIKAYQLVGFVLKNFSNTDSSLFFYTSNTQENIIVKKVDVYDGAVPSGNAILALCLKYLSGVFFDDILRKRFQQMLVSLQSAIVKYPTSFAAWAAALQSVNFSKEIVVTGIGSNEVITNILEIYIPNKILLFADKESVEEIALLKNKIYSNDVLYYLCQNETCIAPQKELTKILHFLNI